APGFGSTSIASGGLLYTADSGIVREYSGPTLTDEGNGAINPANVAKKVYYRVTLTRGTGAEWCGVSSFDFGTERLFFGLFPDGTGKFSIYNQSSFARLALSTVNVTVGQTYTMVAKLDFAAGLVTLYVDPDISQSEASNTPIAIGTYAATNWSTAVRLGSGGGGLVSWDNLMVATTWESLRTYEVTNLNDSGAGSLRAMMALARTSGGRITFSPALRSVYAVTGTNRLQRFKRETPGLLELNVPITGLQPDETIAAIDFRPATGELYALGNIPGMKVPVPTPQTRLYKLNPLTGAVTLVGGGPFSTTIGVYGGMGFDFDPRQDRIRVTNENGDNILLHPETGAIAVQSPLAFVPGNSNPPGSNVRVLQTAHTNNFVGAPATTLLGFHNYGPGLIRIGGEGPLANPADGQVSLLVPFTEGPRSTTGFDIADDGAALVSGLPVNSSFLDSKSTLYQLNTRSGKMTAVGLIGNGIDLVTGLAASPSRITLTSGVITVSGGIGFVVDGPSNAPGITLSGRDSTGILDSASIPAMGFRNLTFTAGRGHQGGAINFSGEANLDTVGLLSVDRCTFRENHATSRGGVLSIAHGNVRMSHCTIAGNTSGTAGASVIYQQQNGSFGAPSWATVVMNHCTVTGNHTDRNSAGADSAAIYLPSTKVFMRNCIVAANTNAGTMPGDVSFTGDITSPATVERSLIGNATGTAVTDGVNGNRAGSTASPLDPRLALPGDHGGPNFTAPPWPGSPAIGLAAGSGARSDQRGFLINGDPDAGAADFQGKTDLARWWDTDWDNDGVPFGVEFSLSGSPRQPGPPPVTISVNAAGEPVILTSFEPLATPWVAWALFRSPNLSASWESIFTKNGDASFLASGVELQVLSAGSLSWRATDRLPNPSRMFYRWSVQLNP
ncbi:MAG: hypothetical protein JWL81_3323, partial [Verrucomicrobiales bacterium]|nr:hypothetical protein [Verrucomicrobiales bacterium]